MKKRIQPHIMCGVGDVARYVLLSGDPKRVERIATFFDEARKVADYRGFVTYTGKVKGIEISACSTGIGCPSAAIVVEELAKIGAQTFIRVGTTGALQPEIEVGDLIIPTAAVRADGASRAYVPPEYPAVADLDVLSSLVQAAKKLGVKVHVGKVVSTDAFYAGQVEAWGRANVLSAEMECSIIFILASLKGLRAGAILAVDGNLAKGVKKGEFEPGERTGELDERVQRAIDKEIEVAIEAVKILEEKGA
ncbi:MAG: nucleoside phosphorylase [Candidatus Hadarchaeales archaeon]